MNIFFLLAIIAAVQVSWISGSKLEIDKDHILRYMLVFINDEVPEGDGSLLQNIEKYIEESSKALWTATNQLDKYRSGVQLGTVLIRIPPHWTTKSDIDETWHQCNNADIFITTSKDVDDKKEFFTKQTGKCGEPGEFTKYSYEFFRSGNTDIKGRIIMNEFVKQRYGVFSEKPYKNILTVFDGHQFVQSSCASDIKWSLSSPPALCSLVNNNCKYVIDNNQNHLYSVMFDDQTSSSVFFCDNKTHAHNKLARTLHNLQCDQRSVSEVVMQHSDFRGISIKTPYKPASFLTVKGTYKRIVIVIDVSESMISKLENVKLAAIEFISNGVPRDTQIGLVSFNTTGKIIQGLLPMNNDLNKEILKKAIRSLIAYGSTNIADGMRKAIEVLGSNLESDSLTEISGTIILLTDGKNNEEVYTWDNLIIMQLKFKGVVVHSISYGSDADESLVKVSNVTGGRFIYANPYVPYPDLMNKLSMNTFCESIGSLSIKVFQGSISMEMTADDQLIHLTYVDPFIGKNMILRSTFQSDVSKYNITLINSNNEEYFSSNTIKQGNWTTFSYKIQGIPKTGLYKLKLKYVPSTMRFKRSSLPNNLSFVISSTPEINSPRIIMPTGKLSTFQILQVNSYSFLHITVDLSTSKITELDSVSVVLIMLNPKNQSTVRTMNDDGIGSDVIEGDGIFTTAIFAQDLNFKGYFTFQAEVTIRNRNLDYPIKRTVDFDALLVIEESTDSIVDKVPPARIKFVNITNVNVTNKTLSLSFLATGDDELLGNISKYEIQLVNHNTTINIIKFVQAQSLEPVSIHLNLMNVTSNLPFTILIRGIDPSGNEGQWSPEQIFSWDYEDIYNKYSKFSVMSQFQKSILALSFLILQLNFKIMM